MVPDLALASQAIVRESGRPAALGRNSSDGTADSTIRRRKTDFELPVVDPLSSASFRRLDARGTQPTWSAWRWQGQSEFDRREASPPGDLSDLVISAQGRKPSLDNLRLM